jgi:hypothetical protein
VGREQPPAVVYSYAPGRGHIHANALLGAWNAPVGMSNGC